MTETRHPALSIVTGAHFRHGPTLNSEPPGRRTTESADGPKSNRARPVIPLFSATPKQSFWRGRNRTAPAAAAHENQRVVVMIIRTLRLNGAILLAAIVVSG